MSALVRERLVDEEHSRLGENGQTVEFHFGNKRVAHNSWRDLTLLLRHPALAHPLLTFMVCCSECLERCTLQVRGADHRIARTLVHTMR
jgi:hypothetical protein